MNAGGLWAREVGRMTGLELPILAMEHMYLITEEIPELAEWRSQSSMPGFHVVDLGGEIYMREEGNSLLLGTYERNGVPWAPHSTDWNFGARLLTPDLERIGDNLEVGFQHFPIFQEIGIKDTINGPFTFAPDGNPLIGPVKGQPGHWLACGVMAGLSQGGGVGLSMANWMTDGDPGFDVWGMDNARFGDWATPRYTNAKVRENYGRRFRITFPNEELPAARNHMQSPIHDRLDAHNAVCGASYGLEVALWFQRPGLVPRKTSRSAAPTPSTSSPRRSRRAQRRRAVRDDRLREVRGHRYRRPPLARRSARQHHSAARSTGADADAEPTGQDHR